NWFEHRPLFGQRIVVTRTRDQASQLSHQLLELGADVLEVPTIKLAPPDEHQSLIDAILELNSYDWLVFTSPNGVTTFFEIFFKTFDDLRDIGGVPMAAARMLESGADWITFTSASTVENFHARFNLPELLGRFPMMRLASIGPETTKAITALGVKPAIEPKEHTIAALVRAIEARVGE